MTRLEEERRRFWASAWRYYHYINRASGSPKNYDELAWEHAKERLLAVAEREKWGSSPLEPSPAPHYRHKCPACGILQETCEVCAECVVLWGSAEAALRAKKQALPRGVGEPARGRPQRSRAELRAAELQRRAEIAAALREHLAKYGAVHLSTMATMLGAGKTLLWDVLHGIIAGADGLPPVPLTPPDSYDRYWRVADVHS